MRRKCSYKEFDTAQIGYCLLVTGGMVAPPDCVIEREDGTITRVSIDRVQFVDIPRWSNAYPVHCEDQILQMRDLEDEQP